MSFEKDIFISYAHIDDQPLVEGERGWVSEFHRSLEIRLAQLLGYKPTIWRDIDLDGNHVFNEEILAQLPGIAIMVSVISPRYVKSEWCLREVNEFIKATEKNIGLNINNRSRIFKAIKTPVGITQYPQPIQSVLGYEFFRLDPEGKRINEFSHIFGPEAQRDYWTRLNDIAHDISALLEQMKESPAAGETVSDIPQAAKGIVYLSETTRELGENRAMIRRELQEHGYTVLPDQHLSLYADTYTAEIKTLMESAELIIHLFGANYGIVPEGSEKSIVHLQAEAAAAVSLKNKTPRIGWLVSAQNNSDERQQKLIGKLKTDPELHAGIDIIESSMEDLKFAIHDKLEVIRREKEKKAANVTTAAPAIADDGPKRIYLICDQKDLPAVTALEDALFASGCDVLMPLFEGEQAQVREDHQENLKFCDGVIIYYGQGNEPWLRTMMRDLVKAVGYGREKPLTAKAVYVDGPPSPQKERFRTHDALVINGLNGLNTEELNAFAAKIKS